MLPILVGSVEILHGDAYADHVDVEEQVVDKYAELIVDGHAESCLWRSRGCDGELIPRASLANTDFTQIQYLSYL